MGREFSNIIFHREQTTRRSGGCAPQQNTWTLSGTAQPHASKRFDSVLLAIAGHDLRQPLQIIQSAHELLGSGVRTARELQLLRSANHAVKRLDEHLTLLTSAVRMQEHTKALELVPVRVQDVMNQALQENEDEARYKGITIRTVRTEAMAISDELLLSAALRNLLSNAIKYTRPGGRILVGCRPRGRNIRIDVHDNGIGIAGDHMPKVFEAFTRIDPTQDEGLGIGLFIVRQALGLLGHDIHLASSPSRGSLFSILAARAERAAEV
jgi:two-component system phosphate regulon sensor histidine kinase PhoR